MEKEDNKSKETVFLRNKIKGIYKFRYLLKERLFNYIF